VWLAAALPAAAQTPPVIRHQASQDYCPGSSIFVTNSFAYTGQLLDLVWRPKLPAGWTLAGVDGTGNPRVSQGQIVWNNLPPQNPVEITYELRGPAGADGLMLFHAEVDYQLAGMAAPVRVPVTPDALRIGPEVTLQLRALAGDALQLSLSGPSAGLVEIQAASQFAPGAWTAIGLVTNFTGAANATLEGVNASAKRFFRARPVCGRSTNDVVNCAVQQLAGRLQLSADTISVLRGARVSFPDSCLGCYVAASGCLAAVTQGYDIVLAAKGQVYYLRAYVNTGSVFICDPGPGGVTGDFPPDDVRISLNSCP